MRLSTIVLSGANEHTDAEAIISLCKDFSGIAELGIQVSGDKAYYSSGRYWWLQLLCHLATPDIRIALHLNKDWVEDFCAGKIPPELETFLTLSHPDGSPKIKRIQLNFKIGREKAPNVHTLLCTMKRYARHDFILSYNDSNRDFIRQLRQSGCKIDALLYDSSFGEGIAPSIRPAPVFDDVYQGYAGGLSPDNVLKELENINTVVPPGRSFFIDAEGKLKGEDGHLSLEKCKIFLTRAYAWARDHSADF